MWWECDECGAQISLERRPDVCPECGIAGAIGVMRSGYPDGQSEDHLEWVSAFRGTSRFPMDMVRQ
jgi:hypothetical protein